MAPNELIDIFNDNKEHIGIATRAEAHANGLWHQTFHCWVLRKTQDKNYVLFQLRSPRAEVFPGALDISAAGHLLAGERPEVEGIRELKEELGIDVKTGQAISLGWYHIAVQIGDFINREFPHTFLVEHGAHPLEYNVDPEEVSGLFQVELSAAMGLANGDLKSVMAEGFKLDSAGNKVPQVLKVTKDDIAGRMGSYFLRAFIAAERFFEGKRPLTM